MLPFDDVIVLSALLFGIGLVGLLARRNLLLVLMSLQLMLAAGGLAFVGFDRAWLASDATRLLAGEAFALLSIVVAVGQFALGLALMAAVARALRSLDLEGMDLLKW